MLLNSEEIPKGKFLANFFQNTFDPASNQHMSTCFRTVIVVFVFSMILSSMKAQAVHEPNITNPDWVKPYPPFRIAGNLYYVGTYDLGCYLITTSEGNILVNTGVGSSAQQVKTKH